MMRENVCFMFLGYLLYEMIVFSCIKKTLKSLNVENPLLSSSVLPAKL